MEQTSGFVRVSSAPTNRGSTTFSARDPLHNDTFALAFNVPFESMIRAKEKKDKKKIFFDVAAASHTTRTPSIPIHPSSMLHAFARRGCLYLYGPRIFYLDCDEGVGRVMER